MPAPRAVRLSRRRRTEQGWILLSPPSWDCSKLLTSSDCFEKQEGTRRRCPQGRVQMMTPETPGRCRLLPVYYSFFRNSAASGGRVSRSEYGRPWVFTGRASTPPALPILAPPYSRASL